MILKKAIIIIILILSEIGCYCQIEGNNRDSEIQSLNNNYPKIKEGVYHVSLLGKKIKIQLFCNNDTIRFIQGKGTISYAFTRSLKNQLIYEHNSVKMGKAKIKFYKDGNYAPDRFKFKFEVIKKIRIGVKGKWLSGFEPIDENLYKPENRFSFFERNYNKSEHYITMRDSVRLFTQVYMPKEIKEPRPAILVRTPYGLSPYGRGFPSGILPSYHFAKDKYILVYQNIRGRYMSEGEFRQISPLLLSDDAGTDESTDTYDTADWMLQKLKIFNGNIGVHGVSFGGYLASVAATSGHKAIKAVSSQAPMANGFYGDDFRRNGALYLTHSAYYLYAMGLKMDNPTKQAMKLMKNEQKDSYELYLNLGTLKNITDSIFNYQCNWWNEILSHESNDEYWQSRSVNEYAGRINCPVLHVGGWYDAEDLNGPLLSYQLTEMYDTNNRNYLIMGPWFHGGWSSNLRNHDKMGTFTFDGTSGYFEENIERTFFAKYLEGDSNINISEATMYDTGLRTWREFDNWPPENEPDLSLFFIGDSLISFNSPEYDSTSTWNEYWSDPDNPVPYTGKEKLHYYHYYFTENQQFASDRDDVVTYTSPPLEEDLTVAGKIIADLFVSTSGTDCDWVVKIMDVLSEDTLVGYELLVRGDIMRGKYRNSDNNPEPFIPGKTTNVKWEMPDVLHTFKKGHKIKVQIQSSWFPLYDMNPQKFVSIYEAESKDYIKAKQRVYHSKTFPSRIILPCLELN